MRVLEQQAYLYDTYFVTLLVGIVAPPHRHGVYQLMVSLDGQPCSVGSSLEDLRPGLLHLIRSNVPHAVDGHGGFQAVMLIAPESTLGRQLASRYLTDGPIAVLPDDLHASLPLEPFRTAFAEAWDAETFRPAVETFFAELSAAVPRATSAVHPAITKAVKIIRALDEKKISADDLARAVGLSKSHFLRLFKEHMGTPLRPYLQWMRTLHAFALLFEGVSVSDAAVGAGFSDSAHLNRVIRRSFAMNPTDLLKMPNLRLNMLLNEPPA